MSTRRKKISARSFKRQVIIFFSVTVVLLGLIVYFSFSRTTLIITPHYVQQHTDVTIAVSDHAGATTLQSSTVKGGLVITAVTETQTFSNLSTAQEEPAKATGTVTLYNHWSKAQPLQAGTRLTTADGTLFRTTQRVDIPAGGSIQATLIADQPGKQGEVPPGKFTIVALWAGLQSQIYGESTTAFTGGTTSIAQVSASDLNTARKAVLAAFAKAAQVQLTKQLVTATPGTRDTVVGLLPTITNETSSAQAGDTVSSFTYSIRGTATGIAVAPDALAAAVTVAVKNDVPKDHRFVRLDVPLPSFTISDIDTKKNTATIAASISAETVIRLSSSILAARSFAGLDRQDILSKLSQFDEIASVDIHFSPFWVLHAPELPDHITVQLKNPVTGQ